MRLLASILVALLAAGSAHGAAARARDSLAPRSLDSGAPVAGSGTRILLTTGFEEGILPADWSLRRSRTPSDSLPGSWFVAPTDPEVAIGDGDFLVWANWDTVQSADEWLITPRLDLSDPALTEVAIDFLRIYHDPARWADQATLTVLASRDDGATFPDTLYTVTPRSRAGRERVSIDLSGYLGGFTFRVAFLYAGLGGDSAGVDDVVVHAGLPVRIMRRSWGEIKRSSRP